MTVIIDKEVFVQYAQVALISLDSKDYPQWETGKETYVSNTTGVAVATETDIKVRVVVSTKPVLDGYFLGSTTIIVGTKDLLVGNELSADTHQISWESGISNVTIYIDDDKELPKAIEFVLEKI